jgi:hypothetical protein
VEFGIRELEILDGIEGIIELLRVARANESARDARIAKAPSNCHLRK